MFTFFSVNEKIYIFIWFWLLFLGFLSSTIIIYRIVIVFSPYIRAFVLRIRYRLASYTNINLMYKYVAPCKIFAAFIREISVYNIYVL